MNKYMLTDEQLKTMKRKYRKWKSLLTQVEQYSPKNIAKELGVTESVIYYRCNPEYRVQLKKGYAKYFEINKEKVRRKARESYHFKKNKKVLT